jgi:hypothetical protein
MSKINDGAYLAEGRTGGRARSLCTLHPVSASYCTSVASAFCRAETRLDRFENSSAAGRAMTTSCDAFRMPGILRAPCSAPSAGATTVVTPMRVRRWLSRLAGGNPHVLSPALHPCVRPRSLGLIHWKKHKPLEIRPHVKRA